MGNDERAKLRTMLNYWIKHNREHSQEFREWADRARGFGEAEVAKEMLKATQVIDKAGKSLSQALKGLEKKEL